jgi:hypothetical protein
MDDPAESATPQKTIVAQPSDQKASAAPEFSTPMLDVHAPHQSIHTWKDFFIHIATIAIGLLIAIGLEQTVEFFHHQHQLHEARERLAIELDHNREVLRLNLDSVKNTQAELERDMAVIHAYQSSHTPMSGKLNYQYDIRRPRDAAWLSVKQNGALGLMPYDEMMNYNYLYELLGDFMDSVIGFTSPIKIAAAIARRAPDENFTPQDIEALIAATSEAQGKVDITAMLLGIEDKWLQTHGEPSQQPE